MQLCFYPVFVALNVSLRWDWRVMAVAGLVAAAALSDLIVGIPFSGSPHTRVMDIIFIVCSGIVMYLGWSVFREMC